MKKQPTIAHSFGTHTIACVFHDFKGFQEISKIMKERHTIVCRFFHDFGHFLKSFKIMKNTCYSMCLETMSYSRLFFHGFHCFLKFFKIAKNNILYGSVSQPVVRVPPVVREPHSGGTQRKTKYRCHFCTA